MTRPDTPPLTMRARTPEDLLAMVPVLLGFVPTESVTMLTLGPHRMHARVDLPRDVSEIAAIADALLRPCLQQGVERVALVLHAVQPEPAKSCARMVQACFEPEGIEVVEMLRADGRCWFPVEGAASEHDRGVPYDVSVHPFVAQAVLRGEIVFASRAELADSLNPNPARVTAVQSLLRTSAVLPAAVQAAWVVGEIRKWLEDGAGPSDADLARLLPVLAWSSVRDAAWQTLTRDGAARHVELWRQVLVAAPEEFRSAPAGLLAFAAWLAGNGALAWCAVDVVDPAAPDQTMAEVVRAILEQAVPPSAWETCAEASLSVTRE